MSIGSRIREIRKGKGLTQRELAELSGVSQSSISLIEGNKRPNVSALVVADIARTLRVSLDRLLDVPNYDPSLQAMLSQIEDMTSEEREAIRFAIEVVLTRRRARSEEEEQPEGEFG